jgi:hypothetical protein
MHDLAGDKGRSLQIHHCIDDLPYLAHAAHRLQSCEEAVRVRRMLGVAIAPGETAFTRTFRLAYSIASERVIALSPPLVRAASAAASEVVGCAAIVA